MTQSGSSTEDVAMTALRPRMIAAMQMHGFSAHTHESYLAAVRGLAQYSRRAPEIREMA